MSYCLLLQNHNGGSGHNFMPLTFLSVCLFVCLSVCLFVCLSVCLFVCLIFCFFHFRDKKNIHKLFTICWRSVRVFCVCMYYQNCENIRTEFSVLLFWTSSSTFVYFCFYFLSDSSAKYVFLSFVWTNHEKSFWLCTNVFHFGIDVSLDFMINEIPTKKSKTSFLFESFSQKKTKFVFLSFSK